jgi:hypothetical protein
MRKPIKRSRAPRAVFAVSLPGRDTQMRCCVDEQDHDHDVGVDARGQEAKSGAGHDPPLWQLPTRGEEKGQGGENEPMAGQHKMAARSENERRRNEKKKSAGDRYRSAAPGQMPWNPEAEVQLKDAVEGEDQTEILEIPRQGVPERPQQQGKNRHAIEPRYALAERIAERAWPAEREAQKRFVTEEGPAQVTMGSIPGEPGGIDWIDDPVSDDVDGEGKSRNDGEENEDAVAGQNPTVPDQYSPFPRLQQDAGEPRIGVVVAE